MDIDVSEESTGHQIGERATRPIAHVLTRPAILPPKA